MTLPPGHYESLVTARLSHLLEKLPAEIVQEIRAASATELPELLVRHLGAVIRPYLLSLAGDNNRNDQIELTNRILALLPEEENAPADDEKVSGDGNVLYGVFPRLAVAQERPLTTLSQPFLFTASRAEPKLVSELKREIATADRIDMLVSFIKWSGLRLIWEDLKSFTHERGGSLRVLTTTYMKATDARALEALQQLPNTEVRISFDDRGTRLHAKSHLFHRQSGFTTAYIGSSNISAPAVTTGREWNLKVTATDSPEIVAKCEASFETLWNDPGFELLCDETWPRIKNALSTAPETDTTARFRFTITPTPFQSEVLSALEAEREIYGRFRNLVVAATGTGKTVISALDYRRERDKAMPSPCRLLFVAHRHEILAQSLDCFRTVLEDYNFGYRHEGGRIAEIPNHLFLSIQAFHRGEWKERIPADFFDYIVVDEVHHGAAASYEGLLDHVRPRILLGLTATPERTDCQDILARFEHRISTESRLWDALERGLLSPFHYFAISDSVSLENLAWQGGYQVAELEQVYTGNDARAALIIRAMRHYLREPRDARCLAFCAGIEHAHFMAERFNDAGIPALALDSTSPASDRRTAQDDLQNRRINILCVVDLYNEGVDIPDVDTVLFLRPTESMTVFLQQLGRGLRLASGKECLTVLDFVGQTHREYRFDHKIRALVRPGAHRLTEEIQRGFPHLPSGCSIQMERVAKEYIIENLQRCLASGKRSLLRALRHHTRDVTLSDFLDAEGLQLERIYRYCSWNELKAEANYGPPVSEPDTKLLRKAILSFSHIDSQRYIDFLANFLGASARHPDVASPEEAAMLRMLYYHIWDGPLAEVGVTTPDDAWSIVWRNPILRTEMVEALKYRRAHLIAVTRPFTAPHISALDVHGRYSRDEILAAFDENNYLQKKHFREGVLYMKEKNIEILLVTLEKTEKDFSPTTMYRDYALNESLFHWQSQSRTTPESVAAQRQLHLSRSDNYI